MGSVEFDGRARNGEMRKGSRVKVRKYFYESQSGPPRN